MELLAFAHSRLFLFLRNLLRIFKVVFSKLLAFLFVFSVLLLQRLSAHVLLLASCSNSLGDMLALSGMLLVSGLFFDILAFLEKCFDLWETFWKLDSCLGAFICNFCYCFLYQDIRNCMKKKKYNKYWIILRVFRWRLCVRISRFANICSFSVEVWL